MGLIFKYMIKFGLFLVDDLIRTPPIGGGNTSWRIFTYKELHTATNGFSEDNKLGEGGFGSVYWGKTSDGLQVYTYMQMNFQ